MDLNIFINSKTFNRRIYNSSFLEYALKMRPYNERKAVIIVKDPKVIHLLSNVIKSEIIHLLNKKPMTETHLSKALDLTKGAIGYHLQPLKKAGLINVNRYETGEHGISKYYETAASLFIVDPDRIPDDAKRFFLETQMMRLEGVLSIFKIYGNIKEVSSENLEELATAMLRELKIIGQKHISEKVEVGDDESLRIIIFSKALNNLLKSKKYQKLFGNIELE
jgi:DNA-binding transcriptional ArsR family regulator